MASSLSEQQAEEYEALGAIYDGDPNFTQVDERTIQYKYGTEEDFSTALIEIKWPEDYPAIQPVFNLDTFYNNHLPQSTKHDMVHALNAEAYNYIGDPSTYNLIEWAREHLQLLISAHHAMDRTALKSTTTKDECEKVLAAQDVLYDDKSKSKRNLTKSQKRKEWDRMDSKGEKPRGHDWVDVHKHLCQTSHGNFSEATNTQCQ